MKVNPLSSECGHPRKTKTEAVARKAVSISEQALGGIDQK
jgi:hypothetical protein